MLHKNVRHSPGSGSIDSGSGTSLIESSFDSQHKAAPARLVLVTAGGGGTPQAHASSSALAELISISAHRCSAFFAEAAVLVLVLALLDRYMATGRLQMTWVAGAFGISLALLAASVATDFGMRRWRTLRPGPAAL